MKRVLSLLVLASFFACGEDSPLGPQAVTDKAGEDAKAKKKEPAPQVVVGLERLVADKGGALRGKKVGLVVHAASVTAEGKHSIDVLKAQGVDVVRLFSPEHGLRSQAAAGEKVKSGVDKDSKIPLVSLYGDKTKPTADDLKGLDALVFDLQDGGVRFYTYVSTMLLCLDAAADAGLEFVVLDRPNPLGGLRVEGPERDAKAPTSLVSMAPGPLVHGLTAGEMARLANARRAKPGKVTVVSMMGWKRAMTWKDTGRPWVAPSPNLGSAEAAIAYPGTCLLEATNVSEGRGTDTPFLLLGAPWIAAGRLDTIAPLPGFALTPATFTPAPEEGAPSPKHVGQECRGLRVQVKDASLAEPYRLGLTLLELLRKEPGFKWNDGGAGLDRLLGTSRVREALDKGLTPDAILEQDAAALTTFRKERAGILLY